MGLKRHKENGSSINELRKSVCILDCLDSCGERVISIMTEMKTNFMIVLSRTVILQQDKLRRTKVFTTYNHNSNTSSVLCLCLIIWP